MTTTSVSLLDRLKTAAPDATDWRRVNEIYFPLIQRWLKRIPGLGCEVDDLAQDVLLVLIRRLPSFERKREGSFRAWLRQITVNRVRSYHRQRRRRPIVGLDPTDAYLEQLAAEGDLAKEWDAEHDRHVFRKLLAIVQPDFQPITWGAFQRFALDGSAAADVAQELGLSVASVLQAKARVLKRLRAEAGELLK
jgi:RNA polymerase sigma-70 factor (ECF subfamily)